MTDEQIIKALECCITNDCAKCKAYDETNGEIVDCLHTICRNALDLINRQKEEIDELRKRIVFWREDLNYQPEAERAKAIKEFAERVKDKIPKRCKMDGIDTVNVYIYIDNLVKEMTEPVKLEHNSLCETETYMGE